MTGRGVGRGPMGDWIGLLHWRHLVERLGGPQGVLGVLLCAALPVVPLGLAVASALGRYVPLLASRRGDVGCVLVAWVLVLAWVGRAVRGAG